MSAKIPSASQSEPLGGSGQAWPWPSDSRDFSGGGGRFGTWAIDEFGLPVYRYELDQHTDPLGTWNTRLRAADGGAFQYRGQPGLKLEEAAEALLTLGGEPTDESTLHWHQIGNDRIIAVTTNEGWTQLYSHEYGPRWINMYRPGQNSFAGGVSFASCNGEVLSTLYSRRSNGTCVERRWGCSYSTFRLVGVDFALERTVFAPFGDSPFLVSLVRLRNLSSSEIQIKHLEYWDLNVQPIDATGPGPWHFDTRRRDTLAELLYHGYDCAWDSECSALIARHPWRNIIGKDQDWPGGSQRTRPDVCLVPLGVDTTDTTEFITDRAALFPRGDLSEIGPLGERFDETEFHSDHPVLSILSEHVLEPDEQVSFGFAYGATPATETAQEISCIRALGAEATFRMTMGSWKAFVPAIETEDENLAREIAWSAYYLRSGAVYHRAFNAHTLPQGGAYQYLAGENAGPRATLQHALPLIWLAPDLTREALRFTFAETHPSGEIPYSEHANGALDALRYLPSDHALWLLWCVSDYVLAMRDRAFLREICSYWPAPYTRPEPVWDHCVRSFRHLVDEIGIGPHGLLRMRTSDWNDAIVREGNVPIDRVWAEGESTLNSTMAVHVLRRFAELARYVGEPRVAGEATAFSERLAESVRNCWRGRHLNRGWRAAESEVGWSDLYLEPQPWALIAEILDKEQSRVLVDELDERLADPLGSRIFAAGEEGNPPTAGGGQWLSINSTLVWGLAKVDPKRAWSELKANTLHNHATVYPDVWFGIWSGPDTYLPASSRFAGQTWAWPGVFGMQAWPVQILFAHSEPLNALLWLFGVNARADVLQIEPRVPLASWSWHSQRISIEVSPEEIALGYTSEGTELLPVELATPQSWRGRQLLIIHEAGGRDVVEAGDRIRTHLPLVAGRRTSLSIKPTDK